MDLYRNKKYRLVVSQSKNTLFRAFDPGDDADLGEFLLRRFGLVLRGAFHHRDDDLFRKRIGFVGADLAEFGDQRNGFQPAGLVGDLGQKDSETRRRRGGGLVHPDPVRGSAVDFNGIGGGRRRFAGVLIRQEAIEQAGDVGIVRNEPAAFVGEQLIEPRHGIAHRRRRRRSRGRRQHRRRERRDLRQLDAPELLRGPSRWRRCGRTGNRDAWDRRGETTRRWSAATDPGDHQRQQGRAWGETLHRQEQIGDVFREIALEQLRPAGPVDFGQIGREGIDEIDGGPGTAEPGQRQGAGRRLLDGQSGEQDDGRRMGDRSTGRFLQAERLAEEGGNGIPARRRGFSKDDREI